MKLCDRNTTGQERGDKVNVRTVDELDLPVSLDRLRELLVDAGAGAAWLFGSYSRGEQRPDSDLDILVEMAEGKTGWDFLGLVVEIEKNLPVPVDVMTKISAHFEEYILPDLIQIL